MRKYKKKEKDKESEVYIKLLQRLDIGLPIPNYESTAMDGVEHLHRILIGKKSTRNFRYRFRKFVEST